MYRHAAIADMRMGEGIQDRSASPKTRLGEKQSFRGSCGGTHDVLDTTRVAKRKATAKTGARSPLAHRRSRPAPRLFVVMAAAAPVAVVIRRGPASWAQLTLWNTDEDAFTEGAWFRGRIFAEKCDLSPDGKLFVYAAFKGGRFKTSYTDSWTAVSRPPWLHALTLWPMATTYGGGGRFTANRRLVVRGAGPTHPDHPARGLEIVGGSAEYHRSTEEIEGADWTGRDQRNRLVFAAEGCIFVRSGGENRLLADFNAQVPNPAPPPSWAMEPLDPVPQARRRRK
jgi:hypothetical protein